MNEDEWLAERFERERPRLRAVAHRMLGSVAEADDAVQDAWLRLSRSKAEHIDNLSGWLTTIVTRECLHQLRSRRRRREDPLVEHLPDPIVRAEDPEQEALLADAVSLALLVVLERLTPAERLAFVLHDMFDLPFDEIAQIVDRTPAAARKFASRARRRVDGAEIPRPDPDLARQTSSATPTASAVSRQASSGRPGERPGPVHRVRLVYRAHRAHRARNSPVPNGRSYFDRATESGLRYAGCERDRGVLILGLNDQEPAHRRVVERALGGDGRTVLHADGRRVLGQTHRRRTGHVLHRADRRPVGVGHLPVLLQHQLRLRSARQRSRHAWTVISRCALDTGACRGGKRWFSSTSTCTHASMCSWPTVGGTA